MLFNEHTDTHELDRKKNANLMVKFELMKNDLLKTKKKMISIELNRI